MVNSTLFLNSDLFITFLYLLLVTVVRLLQKERKKKEELCMSQCGCDEEGVRETKRVEKLFTTFKSGE